MATSSEALVLNISKNKHCEFAAPLRLEDGGETLLFHRRFVKSDANCVVSVLLPEFLVYCEM